MTLEDRFGDDDDQEEFHLGAIENLNEVSGRDVQGLRKFHDELQAHVHILEAFGPDKVKHFDDLKRLKTVLSKLPADTVFAWNIL